MDHDKFQQWLRVHKPVQVRLRAALETEKDEFQQLLGHLRENGWVSRQCSRQTTLSHLDSTQLRAGGSKAVASPRQTFSLRRPGEA